MSPRKITLVEDQEALVLSPSENRRTLHHIRLGLQQLSHYSDYARWIEEGVFSYPAEEGKPTTDLRAGKVMHILRVMQPYCPLVRELHQTMRTYLSKMGTCSKQRLARMGAAAKSKALLSHRIPLHMRLWPQ